MPASEQGPNEASSMVLSPIAAVVAGVPQVVMATFSTPSR
jgi:hypothetical protein